MIFYVKLLSPTLREPPPRAGNATSSEKLQTLIMNSLAIFYQEISPTHRVAGLQFFLRDGNEIIFEDCFHNRG